ncbi:hypothetical protein [Polaribacter sp.]|uniref:hypothetical protein n=1 Tax=Polaribacter sp. TaxID=1920175 RepID=UPI004047CB27|tara:strand:+ start:8466 stop:8912 length:447 start_codon:yes stop_codon:yes gene_type:complete
MKYLKATIGIFFISTFLITVTACKNEVKKTSDKEVSVKNVEHKVTSNTVNNQNYAVGSQIPNELVCMVNNAYMGKPQIAVPVNDKTYYGCCQMCVGTLNNDETARTAIDPFSNKKVDKTEAYIVLMKAEGDVSYFETKENYLKYKQKS